MAEFTPIETQEELNEIIGKVRKEATERAESKYADYETLKASNADLTEKLATAEKAAADSAEKYKNYEQNLSDLQGKVHQYELSAMKTKAALSAGLPYEAAERIQGNTEDEIRADAEAFAGMIGPKNQPLADPEPTSGNSGRDALRTVLQGLKEE